LYHKLWTTCEAVSLSILTETLSGPVVLLGFNLFNAFSTPFSLILMSFIGLNGEFPFDGILVVFSIQQKQEKQETITQKSFQRHQKLN
jgi:hypothetical protein